MQDFQNDTKGTWNEWAKHVLLTLQRLEADQNKTSSELYTHKLENEQRFAELTKEQAVSKTQIALIVAGITLVISIVVTLIAAYIERS